MASVTLDELQRLVQVVLADLKGPEFRADADLELVLTRAACSPDLVRPLTNYMPEAFGEVVLRQFNIQVLDECEFVGPDGSVRRFNLTQDPLWMSLCEIASEMFSDVTRRADFSLLARRSAAVDTLNRLLNSGGKPEGTVYGGAYTGMPSDYQFADVTSGSA